MGSVAGRSRGMGYAGRVIPFPATHLSVLERVRSE
jgi:hypothetical protein